MEASPLQFKQGGGRVSALGMDKLLEQITGQPPQRGKMTESAMQYAIYLHGRRRRLYTNISPGVNEWDAMHVSESGYPTCYEIKLSRSDFKADFKKPRHEMLLQRAEKIGYYHLGVLPKYVYYVCFGFNISEEDVPEYAGLMIVAPYGGICIEKVAPVLWKVKMTDEQERQIHNTLAYRYIYGKIEASRIEYQNWKTGRLSQSTDKKGDE